MENANTLGQALFVVVAGIGCIIAGFFLNRFLGGKRTEEAQRGASEIKNLAQREADTIRKEAELQAKDLLIKMRQDFENQSKERRDELTAAEKRIAQREENLDKRVDLLEKKEKDLTSRLDSLREAESKIKEKTDELDKILAEEKSRLQTVANLSQDEARKILLNRIEDEMNC
jgi:ribonucrease Y